MLNGDANERWKKLYKERAPVFRSVANVHVGTRGQSPQAAARKLMEMIDQRIVHVTGSTIEPYDVRIGEGVMGQLAQVLGSKPAKVALSTPSRCSVIRTVRVLCCVRRAMMRTIL